MQVHVRLDHLNGLIKNVDGRLDKGCLGTGCVNSACFPALYVTGQLCAFGEVLGLPARAPITQATAEGCTWAHILCFPIKVPSIILRGTAAAIMAGGSSHRPHMQAGRGCDAAAH